MKTSSFVFLLAALFSALVHGQAYDEIYDEAGQIRPQYERLQSYIEGLTPRKTGLFLAWSRREFLLDNSLSPVPRIIPGAEYDSTLKKGVAQRGQALLAFLKDHYSGRKTYLSAGIIPKATLQKIISRSGSAWFEGNIDPDSITFPYGPDIIRDSAGHWRVIEDNVGYVGGFGDLKLAYDLMIQSHPELASEMDIRNPVKFYERLAEDFIARGKKFGGKAIMYIEPPYDENEAVRLKEIFAQFGIETISPKSKKRLTMTPKGPYLVWKDRDGVVQKEKVGFIYLQGEHYEMDYSHVSSRIRSIQVRAREILRKKESTADVRRQIQQILDRVNPETLQPDFYQLALLLDQQKLYQALRSPAAGLTEAILKGQVGANSMPGIDFLNDKELYVYVESFIRHYLKEEPILRNIPTRLFAKADGTLDEALLKEVSEDLPRYVIKPVDGRGGDDVLVGPHAEPNKIAQSFENVRKEPERYEVQVYTHLSTMLDTIVDLRVLAQVGPQNINIAEAPWGRGLPRSGNGKVNLSDKGREVTVLVADYFPSSKTRIPLCSALF